MIKVVAMTPDEVKYTASQFGPGVQIVSRPPDQKFTHPNFRGLHTAIIFRSIFQELMWRDVDNAARHSMS